MKTKPKCLYPECQEPSCSRGLCHNHYTRASVLIRNGKVSWKILEEAGKCRPSKGATVANWFMESLEGA